MIKIERSFPPPASLDIERHKACGRYDKEDVITQLRRDFHDKCYICEMDKLQDPQVEHLLPHKNGKYVERKFDWNNLFWSCGHCNNVKNQQKYDAGIIDCCNVDPEQALSFRLKDEKVYVNARNGNDPKAVLTAELVNEVFNLRNTGMRVCKSEMRYQELTMEMNKLYDSIEEIQENPDSRIAMRKLKALLRKESKFAAFKRNYIRDNADSFGALMELLQ